MRPTKSWFILGTKNDDTDAIDDADAIDDNDSDWETDSDDGYTSRMRDHYVPSTAANIAAFVQRVKQMAPMVSEIEVTPVGDAEKLFQRRNVLLIDLCKQLFGVVEKHTVITRGSDPMVMYMDLEPIRDLVRIDYFMDKYFMDVMPLIARNARTLQHLDIGIGDADMTGLVRDPDGGGYLEYPCLQTLRLYSSSDS
ncbi:hypothetical protein GGI19_004582, partial [Coemansia pectinata]